MPIPITTSDSELNFVQRRRRIVQRNLNRIAQQRSTGNPVSGTTASTTRSSATSSRVGFRRRARRLLRRAAGRLARRLGS